MVGGSRFFVVVALLAVFAAPELSCFVPRQLFNAADNDCCRDMGAQCASKTMSSPQSCCQSPSQHAQPYISASNHSPKTLASTVSAVLPSVSPSVSLTIRVDRRFVQFHSPPLSPPAASSVLRI